MISTTTFGSLVFLIAMLVSAANASNLGVAGSTYPIAEQDALSEIQDRAKQTDLGKYFDKKRLGEKIRAYKPDNLKSLGRAKKNRAFLVDMTYTLPYDIPDGKGGILYPKGYTFNPLDYVAFPKTIVVINGTDREQVSWFQSSKYYKEIKAMLLITDGSYYEISDRLKRPVFYVTDEIMERLKLKAVPSLIVQKGRAMEVTEVAVEKENKRNTH